MMEVRVCTLFNTDLASCETRTLTASKQSFMLAVQAEPAVGQQFVALLIRAFCMNVICDSEAHARVQPDMR